MLVSLALLAALFLATSTSVAHESGEDHHHEFDADNFTFSKLGIKLPKPLSDFSIAHDSRTDAVYFSGGCDAPDGNVFNKETGYFDCSSISKSLYQFFRHNHTFVTLDDMPTARFRHGMALVHGKLWVLGGRDQKDRLIDTVDVSFVWLCFHECL